ncbi:hypothetical protein TbrSNM41_23490 (plasmid) [Thermus brockianus]|uniref:Uncharacterized protein n=1 Tax=Thermus brockianus TaxID=56956 RepID=A0ABN6NMV2_THEBO|nr:hypothetical protein TbrSNM41_23490 [Thermus brockianus]
MEGRYRHLLIVKRKRKFAEFAQHRYTAEEERNPTAALARYRRVIFHVTGCNPRPFLDARG